MRIHTEMTTPNDNRPSSSHGNGERSESNCFPTLNPQFQADTVNRCPVCHQFSLETAYQPPMIAGKQGYTLAHCKNPNCKMHGRTLNQSDYLTPKGK